MKKTNETFISAILTDFVIRIGCNMYRTLLENKQI